MAGARARTPTASRSPGRACSRPGAGASNAAGPRLLRPAGRRAARGAASRPCATLYHWDLPQALQDARRLAGPRHRPALRRLRRDRRARGSATGSASWMTHQRAVVSSRTSATRSGAHAPGRRDPALALARRPPPAARPRAGRCRRSAPRRTRDAVPGSSSTSRRMQPAPRQPPTATPRAGRARLAQPLVPRPARPAAATRTTARVGRRPAWPAPMSGTATWR